MRQVNHVGNVLKINIGVAAHEGHFFRSLQINLRQPQLQILPSNLFPIIFTLGGASFVVQTTWITTARLIVGSAAASFCG